MHIVKVQSDGETRWINLEEVVRATLARKTGGDSELLVLFFTNQSSDAVLKIDGKSKENKEAIRNLTAALDGLTVEG